MQLKPRTNREMKEARENINYAIGTFLGLEIVCPKHQKVIQKAIDKLENALLELQKPAN